MQHSRRSLSHRLCVFTNDDIRGESNANREVILAYSDVCKWQTLVKLCSILDPFLRRPWRLSINAAAYSSSIYIRADKNPIAARASSFRRFLYNTSCGMLQYSITAMPRYTNITSISDYQLRNLGKHGLISQRGINRGTPFTSFMATTVEADHEASKMERSGQRMWQIIKVRMDYIAHECRNGA